MWKSWIHRVAAALRTAAGILDIISESLNAPALGYHTEASVGHARKHVSTLMAGMGSAGYPNISRDPVEMLSQVTSRYREWARRLAGRHLLYMNEETITSCTIKADIEDDLNRIELGYHVTRFLPKYSTSDTGHCSILSYKLWALLQRFHPDSSLCRLTESRCPSDFHCIQRTLFFVESPKHHASVMRDSKASLERQAYSLDLLPCEISLMERYLEEAMSMMTEASNGPPSILKRGHIIGSIDPSLVGTTGGNAKLLVKGANDSYIQKSLLVMYSVSCLVPLLTPIDLPTELIPMTAVSYPDRDDSPSTSNLSSWTRKKGPLMICPPPHPDFD